MITYIAYMTAYMIVYMVAYSSNFLFVAGTDTMYLTSKQQDLMLCRLW